MTLSGMNGAIRRGFLDLLKDHLPNRTKRLVLLASLTARLKGTKSFDNETLQKLNHLMELCKNDSALKLPCELSRAIWRGKTSYELLKDEITEEALSSTRLREMSKSVIDSMPAWLRYGTDVEIEQDVELLLRHKSMVLGK